MLRKTENSTPELPFLKFGKIVLSFAIGIPLLMTSSNSQFVAGTLMNFLHGTSLIIHEAGHVLFGIGRHIFYSDFTEIIAIAGGSAFQIVIPLIFFGHFWLRESWYNASFALLWIGQNFIDVAMYMKDATKLAMPLLSENLIHDWNYLFDKFNLLFYDQQIGNFFKYLGILCLLIGMGWPILLALANSKETSSSRR